MQTAIRQASRLVETARREPLGMSLTRADDLDAAARPDEPRQQVGQALPGAFHARRHDAGGDHGGLEQPQVVAREVEHLGQAGDVGGGAQVDAGQAQHRLVDDAEVGFDRRAGLRVARRARPGRWRR